MRTCRRGWLHVENRFVQHLGSATRAGVDAIATIATAVIYFLCRLYTCGTL